jgi:hypothetical protein
MERLFGKLALLRLLDRRAKLTADLAQTCRIGDRRSDRNSQHQAATWKLSDNG